MLLSMWSQHVVCFANSVTACSHDKAAMCSAMHSRPSMFGHACTYSFAAPVCLSCIPVQLSAAFILEAMQAVQAYQQQPSAATSLQPTLSSAALLQYLPLDGDPPHVSTALCCLIPCCPAAQHAASRGSRDS
jgi:hypothetical protein